MKKKKISEEKKITIQLLTKKNKKILEGKNQH